VVLFQWLVLQMSVVAMGSPLSPVIHNFLDFEEDALSTVAYKPKCWFHYVDGAFTTWLHEPEELKNFPKHLSNIYSNIKFIMETETNSNIPFLDINIQKTRQFLEEHFVQETHPHQPVSEC